MRVRARVCVGKGAGAYITRAALLSQWHESPNDEQEGQLGPRQCGVSLRGTEGPNLVLRELKEDLEVTLGP